MNNDRYRALLENYRIIRPEHEHIHQQLLNWVNWVRIKWHPSRVKSLEGRYRPPPCWEPPAPSNPPDLNLAHKIEDLIREAPNHYGEHLRLWYIRRVRAEIAERKLHLRLCQLEPHLAASREFILTRLTVF